MDNVFLADVLRTRFARAGIPHTVRGFRFRGLFYFFGPLFKMSLLVPEDDVERAEAVIEATDFRIV